MADKELSARDLADQIAAAWKQFEAVPEEFMTFFTKGWGKSAAHVFVGVKPSDVDIDDNEFLTEMPLNEVGPNAASAYLGPYLRAFFLELAFEEQEGYYSEPFLRSHVMVFLTNPRVWSDTLQYTLPDDCKVVLSRAVAYILKSAELLDLDEEDIRRLERLSRSIRRDLEA